MKCSEQTSKLRLELPTTWSGMHRSPGSFKKTLDAANA